MRKVADKHMSHTQLFERHDLVFGDKGAKHSLKGKVVLPRDKLAPIKKEC